jgi:hypothetical protein
MDWNDPAARGQLIEQVGPDEYNRLQREHMARSVVAIVNGYDIRPVRSPRFGLIFMVDGANVGFAKQSDAEARARSLPARR